MPGPAASAAAAKNPAIAIKLKSLNAIFLGTAFHIGMDVAADIQ
jgi:hypothetical protein